jgi:hypothetical protein
MTIFVQVQVPLHVRRSTADQACFGANFLKQRSGNHRLFGREPDRCASQRVVAGNVPVEFERSGIPDVLKQLLAAMGNIGDVSGRTPIMLGLQAEEQLIG